MKRNEQETFCTKDLYLASALAILLNTQPDYQTENEQVIFIFSKSNELYQAIAEYNSGCSLPAYSYAQAIKRLRGEMIARRGLEGKVR